MIKSSRGFLILCLRTTSDQVLEITPTAVIRFGLTLFHSSYLYARKDFEFMTKFFRLGQFK